SSDGHTHGITIGGPNPGEGNLIAYHDGPGISIGAELGTDGVIILGNVIRDNGALGIDIIDVDGNDGDLTSCLPNQARDSPVIVPASLSDDDVVVGGYVGAGAPAAIFAGARTEIFRSTNDPSGYGQARQLLGVFTADMSGGFG